MQLAFMIPVEGILVSSSDPSNYAIRKDAGQFLEWCDRYGEIFLHTDMPQVAPSPTLTLDVDRVIEKTGYRGQYKIWTGEVEARTAPIRKSKRAGGFGQTHSIAFDASVDKIANYSRLQDEGYTIVHIDAALSDIEKQQLEGLGGFFISVPEMVGGHTHEIRWVWDEIRTHLAKAYAIVRKSDDFVCGEYESTIFEKSLRSRSEFRRHGSQFIQEMLDRHSGELSEGILNHVQPVFVDEIMKRKGVERATIRKSEGQTLDAIDYWAYNPGRKKADEA